ncbi:hypothetical protein NA57DRAFT_17540, partial [Rhizodiscina lignyota]
APSHASKPSRPKKLDATPAAQPTRTFVDIYNSTSTGHQVADNPLSRSTAWRDSRSRKLSAQFSAGQSGGERLYDTVGAGSENFGNDGRKPNGGWQKGASGLRAQGQRSILEAMGAKSSKASVTSTPATKQSNATPLEAPSIDANLELDASLATSENSQPKKKKQIFDDLCIYINGSTAPLISDHKLKRLLAEHGARMSIALGRRSITHVILGTNCRQGGVGGGLAGGKIQKEVTRVGGKGIKFVGPEWVIESIKAGKRLPEARFSNLKLASKGQQSVYDV